MPNDMNVLSPADAPILPPFAGGAPVTYVVQQAPEPLRWRDRPWLWIGLAASLALALGFVLAPWLAYRAVASAARYDDPAALAQLVDYDAVRASLRPQLVDPQGARAAPPPANPLVNPLGALQGLWAQRAWAPAVQQALSPNVYLSPNGLFQILAGKAQPRQSPPPAPAALKTPMPALIFFGGQRVRFSVHDPSDSRRETVLMFARGKGWFDWRLAGVVLPQAVH